MSQEAPARKNRFDGPAGLAVVLLAAIVAAALVERFSRPAGGEALSPTPMPPLRVAGWVNTPAGGAPTTESLRGRWFVVDAWATWCGPCVQSMPRLAEFYRDWRDRGVEIVGLTSEPEGAVDTIESLARRVDGMDWPIAYGAGFTIEQMGVAYLPTYTLVDPEGHVVWRGNHVGDLDAALAERYR